MSVSPSALFPDIFPNARTSVPWSTVSCVSTPSASISSQRGGTVWMHSISRQQLRRPLRVSSLTHLAKRHASTYIFFKCEQPCDDLHLDSCLLPLHLSESRRLPWLWPGSLSMAKIMVLDSSSCPSATSTKCTKVSSQS